MYYPSSENKGADQLRGYREADLRLCFRLCRLLVFPWGGSCPCIEYPHLYIEKTGVYMGIHVPIFLIIDPKHRLWVLVRREAALTCIHNQCFEQNIKFMKVSPMKFSTFNAEKNSLYTAWAKVYM